VIKVTFFSIIDHHDPSEIILRLGCDAQETSLIIITAVCIFLRILWWMGSSKEQMYLK